MGDAMASVSGGYNAGMAEREKTTRRDFILGQSVVDELGGMLPAESGASVLDQQASHDERPAYLVQISRRAMACEWSVFLNAGQHIGAEETAIRALDLVDELEDQLSVFRDDSEICGLNRLASTKSVEVGRRLFGLLSRSVEASELTDGAFDITAGPISKLWGFLKRDGRFPNDRELSETLNRVGSRWLALDIENHAVAFLRDGLEINLGAIGKGHALDQCVSLMHSEGVDDFLIHGGQSSVVARGSRGGGDRGWTVGVKHPLRPDLRLAEIFLRDQALGTSGSAAQSFRHQGKRYGHILDPRTGYPADGVLSATVIAPDATVADALSTAFYVLGVERSFEICESRPDWAAIFVLEGRRSGAVEIQSFGLADDVWRQQV